MTTPVAVALGIALLDGMIDAVLLDERGEVTARHSSPADPPIRPAATGLAATLLAQSRSPVSLRAIGIACDDAAKEDNPVVRDCIAAACAPVVTLPRLAAQIPAAGVSEPSTLVIRLSRKQPSRLIAAALNSRSRVDALPMPVARCAEPILPGYTSYTIDAAELHRETEQWRDRLREWRTAEDVPYDWADLATGLALRDAVGALRTVGVPCRRFIALAAKAGRDDHAPDYAWAAQMQALAEGLGERVRLRTVDSPTARGAAIRAAITVRESSPAAFTTPANSMLIKTMTRDNHERLFRPDRQRSKAVAAWRDRLQG